MTINREACWFITLSECVSQFPSIRNSFMGVIQFGYVSVVMHSLELTLGFLKVT